MMKSNYQYQKPERTFQDRLTNQDINNKLKDYVIVEDIQSISLNTHLRYFIIDPQTKKRKFRMGGILTYIDHLGRFIKLSNEQLTWSVQIQHTIFYKKLNPDEYKEEIKKEILTDNNDSKKKNKEIKNLILKIDKLIDENNILKKNNNKLIKQLNKIQLEINKK